MLIYCDMDGVLVAQRGRERFDLMGWTADGKKLWDYIKPFNPSLLSMTPDSIHARASAEKAEWARRELGESVPVIVVKDSNGKSGYSSSGAILIDDGAKHGAAWSGRGGIFIHHKSADATIAALAEILKC